MPSGPARGDTAYSAIGPGSQLATISTRAVLASSRSPTFSTWFRASLSHVMIGSSRSLSCQSAYQASKSSILSFCFCTMKVTCRSVTRAWLRMRTNSSGSEYATTSRCHSSWAWWSLVWALTSGQLFSIFRGGPPRSGIVRQSPAVPCVLSRRALAFASRLLLGRRRVAPAWKERATRPPWPLARSPFPAGRLSLRSTSGTPCRSVPRAELSDELAIIRARQLASEVSEPGVAARVVTANVGSETTRSRVTASISRTSCDLTSIAR